MSAENQNTPDNNTHIGDKQTSKNPYMLSFNQNQQKTHQYLNLMTSQKIRKSSFLEDQQQQQQKSKTYNMLQSTHEKKSSSINKKTNKIQENQLKNTQQYESEHQEYQSISSDRSELEEELEELKEKIIQQEKNKLVEQKQVAVVRNYRNLIQDKKGSQQEQKTHKFQGKFSQFISKPKNDFGNKGQQVSHKQQKSSSTQKIPGLQSLYKSTPSNQLKKPNLIDFSINSQDKQISTNNIYDKPFKELHSQNSISKKYDRELSKQKNQSKYVKSTNSVNSQQQKKQSNVSSVNKTQQKNIYPSVSFLVQSKYIEPEKKSSIEGGSNQQVRRSASPSEKYTLYNKSSQKPLFDDKIHIISTSIQKNNKLQQQSKLNEVHFITSQQRREKQEKLKQQQQQVKNKNKLNSNQKGSSLFYVSISGQAMYPSLDLKNKVKQIAQNNKEKQQNERNFSKIHVISKKQQRFNPKTSKLKTPQLPISIKIQTYRSQFFMKIQTQIFTIKVIFSPQSNPCIQMKNLKTKPSSKTQSEQQNPKNYQIQRRFSDFVFLYESIITNQLGYIIYPFPQKTLQSFIKIKLQSIVGSSKISQHPNNSQAQKAQLIQKRIQQLQKFVNYILNHDQLRYCEEIGIFLCEDYQLYQKSKVRIEKYVQEYQELETTNSMVEEGTKNIKKALQTGMSKVMQWWGTSTQQKDINKKLQKSKIVSKQAASSSISQQDIQFGQYFQKLSIYYSKYQLLQITLIKFLQTQQKFINFKDIDTQFDYLVKLCTKVSSGKQYHKNIIQAITIEMLKDIQITRKWLNQTKGQIQKREGLKQLIFKLKETLAYAEDNTTKISKLERRLERFEKNFRQGFENLINKSEQIFQQNKYKFIKLWQGHCKNMKKLWRQK